MNDYEQREKEQKEEIASLQTELMLVALEFGYKACERNESLEAAKKRFTEEAEK